MNISNPFATYFHVHQGYRILTHSHMEISKAVPCFEHAQMVSLWFHFNTIPQMGTFKEQTRPGLRLAQRKDRLVLSIPCNVAQLFAA